MDKETAEKLLYETRFFNWCKSTKIHNKNNNYYYISFIDSVLSKDKKRNKRVKIKSFEEWEKYLNRRIIELGYSYYI